MFSYCFNLHGVLGLSTDEGVITVLPTDEGVITVLPTDVLVVTVLSTDVLVVTVLPTDEGVNIIYVYYIVY